MAQAPKPQEQTQMDSRTQGHPGKQVSGHGSKESGTRGVEPLKSVASSMQEGPPSQQVHHLPEPHENDQDQSEGLVHEFTMEQEASENRPIHAILKVQKGHI